MVGSIKSPITGPARGGLAPLQVKRACERLESDLSGKLSLRQIAAEFGLSVSQFSRAFRISTGLPPYRWLLGQRVSAAERSEARKTAILNSALDCIITIDHEGPITEFNPAAERIFGYRRDDVVGKELAAIIVPPSMREKHQRGLVRHLVTGEKRVIGTRVEMTAMSELQRDRVHVQTEFADDLPLVVGDRVQLQQVILNLIRNASDAIRGIEDRPRQLIVKTKRDPGDHVRVTVQDAGAGFNPQDAVRLFDAFYTTKAGGMGIGLSVSRSIVENHRGRLWVTPNETHGASFSFSIPLGSENGQDQEIGVNWKAPSR
jgi:PAS domain S-box-containing protein